MGIYFFSLFFFFWFLIKKKKKRKEGPCGCDGDGINKKKKRKKESMGWRGAATSSFAVRGRQRVTAGWLSSVGERGNRFSWERGGVFWTMKVQSAHFIVRFSFSLFFFCFFFPQFVCFNIHVHFHHQLIDTCSFPGRRFFFLLIFQRTWLFRFFFYSLSLFFFFLSGRTGSIVTRTQNMCACFVVEPPFSFSFS